jgi:hypothetical protein
MSKKSKREKKRKQGRPRIVLTEDQINQVAAGIARGLTLNDMALILGIGTTTLDRRIAEDKQWFGQEKKGKTNLFGAIEVAKSQTKGVLFTTAYNLAKNGNTTMLTFLMSRRYGMSENVQVSGPNNGPVIVEVKDDKVKAITEALLDEIRERGIKFE